MFKVSASQLSTIQSYRDGELTLEEVVEKFTTSYSSQAMNIGTSFHSIIEAGRSFILWSNSTVISPDYAGYAFDKQEMLSFYDWLQLDGTQVHEYKERYPININGRDWLLTAKCDILSTDKVIDIKTTYSSYDWERYYNSPQWKVYCLVFNVPEFEYRTAHIKLDPAKKLARIASKHLLALNRSYNSDAEVIELLRLTDEIERNTKLNFTASESEWEEAMQMKLVS